MLFLLALAMTVTLTVAETTYYVRPTYPSNVPCPASFCNSLEATISYALRISGHVNLVFLPGTHVLSKDLDVDRISWPGQLSLTMSGANRAAISCNGGVEISFTALKTLEIDGLAFMNCGSPDPRTLLPVSDPFKVRFTSYLSITNCTFSIKKTKLHGCRETRLENTRFQGLVYVTASDSTSSFGETENYHLSIDSCSFLQGENGGRLKIKNLQHVDLTNSLFSSLTGEPNEEGGAISIENSNVSLSGVLFQNNSAYACGTMYAKNSIISMTATYLTNSFALKEGAICAEKSILHISDSSITHNSADKEAGGLYLVQSDVAMQRVMLSSNKGYKGGAIKTKSSVLSLQNVAFVQNSASYSGGAIYAESSEVTLSKTVFRYNSDPLGRTIVADATSRILRPGGRCTDFGREFECLLRARIQSLLLSGQCNSFAREVVNEGMKPCMYRDKLDIPTIGIGFNLRRSDARQAITAVGADYDMLLAGTQCLSNNQIRQLFNQDMASAISCAQRFVGSNWSMLGQTRQSAVADMAFNLGCTRLGKFRRFQAALQSTPPDFAAAVTEMVDSRWCRQVGQRCNRNVKCMN